MNLPRGLAARIEAAVSDRIAGTHSVGGGCIARTLRLDFEGGDRAFLKWALPGEQPAALFELEARALAELRAANAVRVPSVSDLYAGDDGAYLLLEWLEPGARTTPAEAELGRNLARLHQCQSTYYGWEQDNFIGSLPQQNPRYDNWSDFWCEQRLLPQLERAASQLTKQQRVRVEQLAHNSAEIIGETAADGPSLLHGDLWGGNVHYLAEGGAAVIDPSTYYGHREVDLAMSRLFGGFGAAFYDAYQEVWPTQPGLQQRLLLYQLYYLLVHVNLFGGSYTAQTMAVVAQLGF